MCERTMKPHHSVYRHGMYRKSKLAFALQKPIHATSRFALGAVCNHRDMSAKDGLAFLSRKKRPREASIYSLMLNNCVGNPLCLVRSSREREIYNIYIGSLMRLSS